MITPYGPGETEEDHVTLDYHQVWVKSQDVVYNSGEGDGDRLPYAWLEDADTGADNYLWVIASNLAYTNLEKLNNDPTPFPGAWDSWYQNFLINVDFPVWVSVSYEYGTNKLVYVINELPLWSIFQGDAFWIGGFHSSWSIYDAYGGDDQDQNMPETFFWDPHPALRSDTSLVNPKPGAQFGWDHGVIDDGNILNLPYDNVVWDITDDGNTITITYLDLYRDPKNHVVPGTLSKGTLTIDKQPKDSGGGVSIAVDDSDPWISIHAATVGNITTITVDDKGANGTPGGAFHNTVTTIAPLVFGTTGADGLTSTTINSLKYDSKGRVIGINGAAGDSVLENLNGLQAGGGLTIGAGDAGGITKKISIPPTGSPATTAIFYDLSDSDPDGTIRAKGYEIGTDIRGITTLTRVEEDDVVIHTLPPCTSADKNKVLTVSDSGTVIWGPVKTMATS